MSLVSSVVQLTYYSLFDPGCLPQHREVSGCLLKDKPHLFLKDRSQLPAQPDQFQERENTRHTASWVSLTGSGLQQSATTATEQRQVKSQGCQELSQVCLDSQNHRISSRWQVLLGLDLWRWKEGKLPLFRLPGITCEYHLANLGRLWTIPDTPDSFSCGRSDLI